MDTKQQLLKDTFESSFSIERLVRFSKEFLGSLKIVSPDKENKSIPTEYKYTVDAYHHLATYTRESNVLDIFAVKLKEGRNVERARSMQRSFISKLLTASNHDAAIVAFYTESDPRWRLSFIRLDMEYAAGRVKMNLTPAKRYSYLVGEKEPCHTAMEQLYPIFRDENYNPTIDKIEEAFSVERVTKDFFEKYREKYLILKEYLDGNEVFMDEAVKHGFTSEQFAKKLMGQLAFLYFIQKKGWLGVKVVPQALNEKKYKDVKFYSRASRDIVPKAFLLAPSGEYKLSTNGLMSLTDEEADTLAGCFKSEPWGSGERKFIRHLFEICKNKNFYDDYLEPLFYEALNKKRGSTYYFKRFNCKIPFLNGGLFEPLESYDWEHSKFDIPNKLFSNIDTKGEREADGILDIFDRYNFTMNEDEPLEREVAVDPEMLGKIFENLLDTKDRKSKGAFYTPRKIVHYMCSESLVNYLVGKTSVPYEDMKDFITNGEFMKDEDYTKADSSKRSLPQTVFEHLREIDKALENIKVADPAVGSGAFPLGMLSEIVKARNNITYYYAALQKNAVDRARIFDQRDPYHLKWVTIQNCIFAVDIEASAVDIAKLRLWLSLVVDENLDPSFDDLRVNVTDQKDPRPLPNLDFNIMCGNSLVDEFDGIKLFDDSILLKKGSIPVGEQTLQMSLFQDSVQLFIDDLRTEQERLFGEQDPAMKKEIKRHIDICIDNIIRAKLSRDNDTVGLRKYQAGLKQKTKPYFLWNLEFTKVFQENGGFDVIIGNPPYIGFHHVPHKEYNKEHYYSANGKYDFYVLFIEKGLQLVRNGGFVSYICPSYFYKRDYGKNTRELILTRTSIKYIADFSDHQIFDSALTYTCIFGAVKQHNNSSIITVLNETLRLDAAHQIDQAQLQEPSWIITQNDTNGVLKKIDALSTVTFGDITLSISQGIVTGCNDAYLIPIEKIEDFELEKNYLKRAYKGKDIKGGRLLESDYMIFYPYTENAQGKTICISEDLFKKTSPKLYNYLQGFLNKLMDRDYFVNSGKLWFELWNPRKPRHFHARKYVFSEIGLYNDFALVDECYYTDSACGAELKCEYKKFEATILLYLNSKTATYIYKRISVPKANGYSIYKNAFLHRLPIILPEENEVQAIAAMKQDEFDNYLYKKLLLTQDEISYIEELFEKR